MNLGYNQQNIEALFKQYLIAGIDSSPIQNNTLKNYLSDVRHFLGWLNFYVKKINQNNQRNFFSFIDKNALESYKIYLIQGNIPVKTINRRLSTVRKFCQFCLSSKLLKEDPTKELRNVSISAPKNFTEINTANVDFIQQKPIQSLKSPTSTPSPFLFQNKKHLKKNSVLIALFILCLFLISSLLIIQAKKNKKSFLTASTLPIKEAKILQFQGRLTDSLGNPQQGTTSIEFKLYDKITGGNKLYSSGSCLITTDKTGSFSVVIGKDCGTKIDNSIFVETPSLYLGTTVNKDIEMTPRQQIGNVDFANNSQKLQGYSLADVNNKNPGASQGAGINTIPIINQAGNLVIAAFNPKLWSTSGTFKLQGQTLTLTTNSGSSGDITISPDKGGNIIFNSGNIGIGTKNPADFELEIEGNIGPHSNSTYNLGSVDLRWKKIYVDEIIGSDSGIQGYWQRNSNALSPINNTDDFLLGGEATSSALIKLAGSINGNSFFNNGNLGVGTTTPQEKISLG
ncbi:MAG: hypothetical protein ACD_12C00045G0001, partial [uncultured bacterium]